LFTKINYQYYLLSHLAVRHRASVDYVMVPCDEAGICARCTAALQRGWRIGDRHRCLPDTKKLCRTSIPLRIEYIAITAKKCRKNAGFSIESATASSKRRRFLHQRLMHSKESMWNRRAVPAVVGCGAAFPMGNLAKASIPAIRPARRRRGEALSTRSLRFVRIGGQRAEGGMPDASVDRSYLVWR
jgi:hypothetical protein